MSVRHHEFSVHGASAFKNGLHVHARILPELLRSAAKARVLEKCIYIDYAFIVSFTALFYFSIIIAARKYSENLSFYWRALMFLPGLLDVIEDTIMLYMIRHGAVGNLTYSLQMVMVYSKWVLVIPCSVLAVMALFRVVSKR